MITNTTTVQRVLGVLVIAVDKNGLPMFQYIGEENSSPMNLGNDAVGMAIPETTPKKTVQPVMAIAPDKPAPAATAETPVKTRRTRRTKEQIAADKAAAEVKQPIAAPAPEVKVETKVEPAPEKKAGRKKATDKPSNKRDGFKVWMPVDQAIAVAVYTPESGIPFAVAIWDSSTSDKTGKRSYKLAFITKADKQDGKRMIKFAYHKEGKWSVDSDDKRLSNITKL